MQQINDSGHEPVKLDSYAAHRNLPVPEADRAALAQ
jgi:hypothetical protein